MDVIKFVCIQSSCDKTKDLWSQLAEYGHEENEYKDYKGGREKLLTAIGKKTDTGELINRVADLQDSYARDV